jgi:hypothetical protein
MKLREDTQSSTDSKYSAVDAVSKYLKCMKDYALSNIRRHVGNLYESEIRWVLTVPAIWEDDAKERMRAAARGAGFPDDEERLILALEPEAAALYCQASADVLRDQSGLPPGTRFMIVDAGGGTVDLTTHEVLQGGGLRELVPGSGSPCGSILIDRQFMTYLNESLMADVVQKFQKQDSRSYLELMDNWERTKCNPNVDSRFRFIDIPTRLYRLLEKDAPEVLRRLADEQAGENMKLVMRREKFRDLFRPVLDKVIAAVRMQFEVLERQREKCDYLFIVGGFAKSPLLSERVREEFGPLVRYVIVPPEPGKSVLHGAVLFGLDPEKAISERKMRRTLGYEISRPRKENDPPESIFNHRDNGAPYCRHCFVPVVREGESVKVNECVSRVANPLYRDQSEVNILLFKSSDPKARYTNRSGVEQVGEVIVKSPVNGKEGLERPIDIEFYFGQTTIRVKATDRSSGEPAEATLKYPTE